MQMRTYFYGAVTIALVVPIIIAISYWSIIYQDRKNIDYIEKLNNKEELLIFNDDFDREQKLENLAIENNSYGEYNFSIKLASSHQNELSYNIVLTDIVATPNVEFSDIGWKLVKVNGDDYEEINSGSLANMSDGRVLLKENLSIRLGEMHHFKLYYHLLGEYKYNRGSLSATVTLE